MKTNFTNQKERYLCVLASFLNSHQARLGVVPTEFSSKEFSAAFNRFLNKNDHGLKTAIPFEEGLKEIDLQLVNVPKSNSLDSLKKHIIKQLKAGHIVAFPYYRVDGKYSLTLLVEHRKWDKLIYEDEDEMVLDFDNDQNLFITLNGYYDVASWGDLAWNLFLTNVDMQDWKTFNSKEMTNMLAKFCIQNTKTIKGIPSKS